MCNNAVIIQGDLKGYIDLVSVFKWLNNIQFDKFLLKNNFKIQLSSSISDSTNTLISSFKSTFLTFFYGITLYHNIYSVLLLEIALWLTSIDDASFSSST